MPKTWKPGDIVALRGIYNRRVWYIQSAVVIQDQPEEVALAILPGAECHAPEGYINGKHGAKRGWNRWDDYTNDNRRMQGFRWHTNRLLILLEPRKYYASINFQLPFRRSEIGFDTLDLELDIIIEPAYEWHWKDANEYREGIYKGVLLKEWTDQIECAKDEIFERIEKRKYPLDGYWLNWRPDPGWQTPNLPADWEKV